MPSRCGFITGLVATASFPKLTWADVGSPKFLAAAKLLNGKYALFGLNEMGEDVFEIPLPGRGHAAVAHPNAPEAVAFARRPGRFALVINCVDGDVQKYLSPLIGQHFYGHGCFINDGRILATSENEIETGKGVIGLWDRVAGYRRIGEIYSGGIGPHEIKTLPNERGLVVANGGIRTHPDSGRKKLNLSTMRPNISFIDSDFMLRDKVELSPELCQNSIRHLDVDHNCKVAFGTQWQGDQSDIVPLVGTIDVHNQLGLIDLPMDKQHELKGYIGSIAIVRKNSKICVTSPTGGVAHIYKHGQLDGIVRRRDIWGVVPVGNGFALSNGGGVFMDLSKNDIVEKRHLNRMWDNHLVLVG